MERPTLILLGAAAPAAAALLRIIEAREWPVAAVRAYDFAPTDACLEFAGESIPIELPADFAWDPTMWVLGFGNDAESASTLIQAANAGCACFNASHVEDGYALAILRVARALDARFGLNRLNAVCNLPVSRRGQAGIDELSNQTRALFALEAVESEVFPVQMAFNLMPDFSGRDASGKSAFERRMADALRQGLAEGNRHIQVSAVLAPLFFGGSLFLQLELAARPALGELRAVLARVPGVTVMDEAIPGGVPSPATDALESDAVFVGQLSSDSRPQDPTAGFSLWLVFDPPHLEALQVAAWLEKMIEKNADKVLT